MIQHVKSNKLTNFGSIIRSHRNIKQRIISFLYPCGYFIEKERLSWVTDDFNNWVVDGSYRTSKWNGTIKQLFWYWWVKFKNVKLYNTWLVFLLKWLKLVYEKGNISWLVDFDGVCNIHGNFSKCFLLTSPHSFFAGLISLNLVLFRKFGL